MDPHFRLFMFSHRGHCFVKTGDNLPSAKQEREPLALLISVEDILALVKPARILDYSR